MVIAMVPVNLALSILLAERVGAAGPVIGSVVGVALFQVVANALYIRIMHPAPAANLTGDTHQFSGRRSLLIGFNRPSIIPSRQRPVRRGRGCNMAMSTAPNDRPPTPAGWRRHCLNRATDRFR